MSVLYSDRVKVLAITGSVSAALAIIEKCNLQDNMVGLRHRHRVMAIKIYEELGLGEYPETRDPPLVDFLYRLSLMKGVQEWSSLIDKKAEEIRDRDGVSEVLVCVPDIMYDAELDYLKRNYLVHHIDVKSNYITEGQLEHYYNEIIN